MTMNIDTTNMCSHLQKKLFEEDGIYHFYRSMDIEAVGEFALS